MVNNITGPGVPALPNVFVESGPARRDAARPVREPGIRKVRISEFEFLGDPWWT